MKLVSLPKHDDKLHAILIDGAYYQGHVVYVPCELANGKQIRIPVISTEGYGLAVRRQPVLLLGAATGPELAVATMHTKRIRDTQNINTVTPHFFLDERALIDVSVAGESNVPSTDRRGSIAYEYFETVAGRYVSMPQMRVLYISDQLIAHPELDKLTKTELDDAYHRMSSADTAWNRLCDDHRTGRVTIDLPGIDLYMRFEQDPGIYLPQFYAACLKQTAGGSTLKLPVEHERDKQRHELVEFIEMLSGMRSMLVDDIGIAYDGAVPEVEFERNGLKLSLLVNELPLFGNFAVADSTQPDFEKKFVIYENLAQALTAITTRMNYA